MSNASRAHIYPKAILHPVGTWVRWVCGDDGSVGVVTRTWDGFLPMMLVRFGERSYLALRPMVRAV